jgi:myosin heavy subunit
VLTRSAGESSFLCFYILFASLMGGPITQGDIDIDCKASYRYFDQYELISSEEARQGLVGKYEELMQDMSRIGLGRETQLQVLRTLAVIVLIGNIEFRQKGGGESAASRFGGSGDDGSECEIDPSCDTTVISRYLGVADVNQLLTTKVIQGGRASSFYHVGLSKTNSKANADALATGLYYKLVGWLASTCNVATRFCGESNAFGRRSSAISDSNYIGVLDMCGFENHVDNSFEQLCVNLCNEKMYSVFYTEVFASEATLMSDESCPHTLALSYDNSPCLTLLDGESGICRLIDEHCVLSRAGQNDSTLLGVICSQHPKHPNFDCSLLSKMRKNDETRFKVKHFAGTVVYNITGFMNSNSEKIEVEPMIANSTNEFIATLHAFQVEKAADVGVNAAAVRKASMTGSFVPRNNRRNVKKTKPTVCADLRSSLAAIMSELQTTALQFITCIKPNRTQMPSKFSAPYVMEQLKAYGIIDILKSHTESYTMNLSWKDLHEALVERGLYQPNAHVKVKASLTNTMDGIKKMFEASLEPHMWFVGSSGRVFLKAIVFDELRRTKNSLCAKSIQKGWKVFRLHTMRHKLATALHVVKQALIKYVEKIRTAKHLAELEEVARAYSYLLMRWRLRVRIERRVAAKLCIWFFKRLTWKEKISNLIRSQVTISNFLQTKRLRYKFLGLKRLAVICQMFARGIACRKVVAPLMDELRHNMFTLKCKKCATQIYG